MYRLPAAAVFLAAAAFQPSVEAQMRSATRLNFPNRVRSSRICLLIISVALVCSSCGVCPPPPFIASISPNNITAGGDQFVLTVNGRDFRHDSSVSWNGSLRITTFVSSHQLKAAITASDIAQPGMVLVFVFNPPETSTTSVSGAIGMGTIANCSGKDSNTVSLTIGA
jgi:hypothetical protein